MFKSLVVATVLLAAPVASQAGIFISVGFAPPALPVYVQPLPPGDGYIWTPGYWHYSDVSGYYWVPGTWVLAPQPGYLWTPPYWGYENGFYGFHPGYWGLHVGFYGGVNYGYGYGGVGFGGGYWRGGVFQRTTIVNNVTVVNRVSYNGGPGGIAARATPGEMAAMNERHVEATSTQMQHQTAAYGNREQWASQNHGRPAYTASARPGEFSRPNAQANVSHPGPVAHNAATPAAHQGQPQAHTQSQPQGQAHTQQQGHGQAQPQAHQKAAPAKQEKEKR